MPRLRLLALAAAVGLSACDKPPAPRGEVSVSGQVLDRGGKPLALKVVGFHPREKDQRDGATGTDDKGRFTLKLVPGLYHVTLAEPGRGPTGGADAGGVIGPDKGGKATGIPPAYRNANETPWKVTVPDGGQNDLKLLLGP